MTLIKKTILLAVLIAGLGCSANYEFGDISKAYCSSVNPTFRMQIRENMKEAGFDLGVDYCAAHGMVDELKVLLSGQ